MRIMGLICFFACLPLHAAEWASPAGPLGANVAECSPGTTLIDKASEARLLWKSDRRIPNSYAIDARNGVAPRTKGANVGGGYSMPLVHAGRVYLYYHRPGGDSVSDTTAQKSVANNGWGREVWTVEGDAVAHCFDAQDGRTLWMRIFPREGPLIDAGFNKGGGHFLSWIEDDRWFIFTNAARIHCLDSKTGALLWSRGVEPRAHALTLTRQRGLEEGKIQYFNRVLNESFAVAGGTLAISDFREDTGMREQGGQGLIGFDTQTGAHRWWLPPDLGDTPSVWRHGQKSYLLCYGKEGLSCIDPENGKRIWLLEGVRSPGAGAPVLGDLMLANLGVKGPDGKESNMLSCLELRLDGPPKERWAIAGRLDHSNHALTAKFVYGLHDNTLRTIDLQNGMVLHAIPAWRAEFTGLVVCGDLLIGPHRKGLQLIKLIPDGKLENVGSVLFDTATSTRVAIANGIAYMRGQSRLHAYDLRKK